MNYWNLIRRILIGCLIMASASIMVSTNSVDTVFEQAKRWVGYWEQGKQALGLKSESKEVASESGVAGEAKATSKDVLAIEELKGALTSFVNYHLFFTEHEYARAYQLLSDNYQLYVAGNYETWVNSFSATKGVVVSSMDLVSQTEDTIIIKYTLHKLVDEGNDTVRREFAGEATLRKEGPVWLIDELKEQPL
ncbi:MAG: hypothetical protein E7204_07720 [Veillonella sp.]|uniref:hypothetical protein n=1 Tax=Veillonella sp. TaxID=1926307 RepID=UPI0025CFEA74|nr:hypothetical protein [Veillonella sp.]MBE6080707.1 hypothetical protein [Veillonella sp.]